MTRRWIRLPLLAAVIAVSTNCASTGEKVVDVDAPRPNDKREYRAIKLGNGIEALLVHDPELKQSAAALDVEVGSMADPEDAPGLAHFLEHMLFLGNRKYPKVGEYEEFLGRNQGWSNAYTAETDTNYHFQVNHEAFEAALDRFSQFFVSPLFTPQYVEREMKAVHSEHQKNLQDDSRRIRRAEQETFRKGHPAAKFSTGSLETLSKVKRETLIRFYEKHYSAGLMKLSMLSTADLDTQERWAREKFSAVPDRGAARLEYPADAIEDSGLPELIRVRPVGDRHRLQLDFEGPPAWQYWRTKPDYIIGFLFGHEGEGSLLSAMKREDLATALSAGVGGAKYRSVFGVNIDLTKKGAEKIDRVIELFFSYLRLAREEGYRRYVFRENKVMEDIEYFYQEPAEGAEAVTNLTEGMQLFPALEVEKRAKLLYDYSEEDFFKFLDLASPRTTRAILIDPGVKTDRVEKHYGVRYSVSRVPDEWIARWENAAVPQGLHYPKPNKFIPEDLSLLENDPNPAPHKIVDDERGVFWFQQDREFKLPKGAVSIKLLTDQANQSARKHLLTELYVATLLEALNEWKYPITMAGLTFEVKEHARGLILRFAGFSDRIPELMKEVFSKLELPAVAPELFATVRDRMSRDIRNIDIEPAYRQASYEGDYLSSSIFHHRDSFRQLIDKVTLEEVRAHGQALLSEFGIEGIAFGNLEAGDLAGAIDHLYQTLDASPIPRNRRVDPLTFKVEPGSRLAYAIKSKSNNHAWLGMVQLGERTDELEAAALVGSAVLGPLFYSDLRTRQQLGYVVNARADFSRDAVGFAFLVESDRYTSEQISERATGWYRDAVAALRRLSPQEFTQYKAGVARKLREKDRDAWERLMHIAEAVVDHAADFGFREKVAQAVEKLSLRRVREIFEGALTGSDGGWLGVYLASSAGQLPKPPGTLIRDAGDFRAHAPTYAPRFR